MTRWIVINYRSVLLDIAKDLRLGWRVETVILKFSKGWFRLKYLYVLKRPSLWKDLKTNVNRSQEWYFLKILCCWSSFAKRKMKQIQVWPCKEMPQKTCSFNCTERWFQKVLTQAGLNAYECYTSPNVTFLTLQRIVLFCVALFSIWKF